MFVENKLSSYAFDCKDWLAFFDAFGIVWHQATVDDLESYIGVMNAAISPTSGEEYRNATSRRRVSTVEGLYKWARDARVYEGALPLKALLLPTVREGSDGGEKTRRRVLVSTTAEENEPIRVMEIEQARAIMNALGPLPTELLHGKLERHFNSAEEAIIGLGLNLRTSRDRLGGEFGLNSGLRISEVRNLNFEQFTKFKSQSLVSNRNYKIRIIGKGRKPRLVDVPGWLIKETLYYIENERSLIVTSVGFAAGEQGLFLNPIFTHRHAGKRVTVRTFERRFSDACVESGQCQLEERASLRQRGDKVEQRTFVKDFPLFVFHDVRHTYAVWTYYARKKAGDSEPWLYIQARLGHAHLTTTVDTYLKAAGDFEAGVTDALMEHLNAIA